MLGYHHRAAESVNFYLAAYVATTLAAFGVIAVVASDARRGAGGDLDEGDLESYRGLLWRRPALAALLVLSLISLAGLPVSIGFAGKFYVLAAGIEARSWALVAALVVGSAIGLRRVPEPDRGDQPLAGPPSGRAHTASGADDRLALSGIAPRAAGAEAPLSSSGVCRRAVAAAEEVGRPPAAAGGRPDRSRE